MDIKQPSSDLFRKLKREALIESTGASMRLAGSKISNEEVARIITHREIIKLVNQHGSVSADQLVELIGIDFLTLNTYLRELVSAKCLVQQGQARAARYTVP